MALTVNQEQARAADPNQSVWVAANAGTGKTKVLTDRVLRLLLAGAESSGILCITYTKAAASEMQNRIQRTLAEWVALSDGELSEALKRLLGQDHIEAATLKRARQLFARVLDAPEGMRIQTFHSFCASILKRFPLEAGVHPHAEQMDDRTANLLLHEAMGQLIVEAAEGNQPWHDDFAVMVSIFSEFSSHKILQVMMRDRQHFEAALAEGGVEAVIERAANFLKVDQQESDVAHFTRHFTYRPSEESDLRKAIIYLEKGSKTDVEKSELMAQWWCVSEGARPAHLGAYQLAFLTKEDTSPRSKLATKKVVDAWPEIEDVLRKEQQRLVDYISEQRAREHLTKLACALRVSEKLASKYSALKEKHKALDYDDLILIVRSLLHKSAMAWVLYKLDGGVDHLLVDEAQDTSEAQWAVVNALKAEFFSGESARAVAEDVSPRSVFVVGDEKQSIYSFQGAAPKAFGEQREATKHQVQGADGRFDVVPLQLSFRSTEAVLKAVDRVFAADEMLAGVSYSGDVVEHRAFRSGEAGLVELWSLAEVEKKESSSVWEIEKIQKYQQSGDVVIAERIANKVADWLGHGEPLEAKNRAVRAGDILVLVQRRGAFVGHLANALKAAGVPVAGVDRMKLLEQIAVMDLLSLAEFLLLPEDDLSLAELLKSPIGGLGDDELIQLAAGRRQYETLYDRLKETGDDGVIGEAKALLLECLKRADQIRPYEFFAWLLEVKGVRQRFAARLGEQVFDPLSEFLNLLLKFERENTPSLQNFMAWIRSDDAEVKRDMEQGVDAVRIMTVHGAKGLQAPIVFLPDTTRSLTLKEDVLWTDDHIPLLKGSSATRDAQTEAVYYAREQEMLDESRRLLYVAMTRAEDRLYICGWQDQAGKDAKENTWYRWMEAGLKSWLVPVEGEEGVLRYACPQTKPHREKADEEVAPPPDQPLPEVWLLPPKVEPFPPQPLAPSRLEADEPPAWPDGVPLPEMKEGLSPIKDRDRFRRGNVIHRLLEYLPDIPPARQEQAGLAYLSRYADDFTAEEQQAMVAEVLAVMRDEAIAPVFAQGSLAEVSLTGLLPAEKAGDWVLSAQIDRLMVNDEGVWILDYKTQRHPPETLEQVPPAYFKQMALYRAALLEIYPDKPIHAALIWTSMPKLMLLPDNSLSASLDSQRRAELISNLT